MLKLPAGPNLSNHGVFHRWVLDVLVVFSLVTQVILVGVLVLGRQAASVAPLSVGAVVTMFLLAYFYARWLLPVLRPRQVLLLLLLKEVGLAVLLGLVVGAMALIRWAL